MTNISWQSSGTLVDQWRALLDQTLSDAAAYINSYLARPINFDISVNFSSTGGAIATGGGDITHAGDDNWEFIAAYQSRTGVEVPGYDAIITFDPGPLENTYYGSQPASGYLIDGFSVIVHEMLHGIGFNGWTDWETYQNSAQAYSPFDRHIQVLHGEPYFNGANVSNLMGGPVLLEAGSVFHLSHEMHDRDSTTSRSRLIKWQSLKRPCLPGEVGWRRRMNSSAYAKDGRPSWADAGG